GEPIEEDRRWPRGRIFKPSHAGIGQVEATLERSRNQEQRTLHVGVLQIESESTWVAELATPADELAADMSPQQPYLALGLEALAEEQALVDLEVVGVEGDCFRVAELATAAVELAADVSPRQPYLALGLEALAEEEAPVDLEA